MHWRRVVTLPCNKEYVYFTDDWSRNYYHWLIDALPRLISIAPLCSTQWEDRICILPSSMKNCTFAIEALEILGLKYYLINEDWMIRALHLRIAARIDYCKMHHVQLAQQMYLALSSNLKVDATKNEFVYISRKDANCRGISNEDDLVKPLSELGFLVIKASRISFSSQIKLFACAKLIVGMHGAGLANIVFSPQNSVLVELRPSLSTNDCFERLCALHKRRYVRINLRSNEKMSMFEGDFEIDVSQCLKIIKQQVEAIE